MREAIYLIGQISVDDERTYQWRRDVREFFEPKVEDLGNGMAIGTMSNFEMIDPCDNEFNKSSLGNSAEVDDAHRLWVYKTKGIGLIVPKDYSYVLRSTGCICNMNQYDSKKPLIGAMFELAWYYQHPEKCVIGVFDGDPTEDVHCNHPFVRETVDIWCKDHMEAAEVLKTYYQRGVD